MLTTKRRSVLALALAASIGLSAVAVAVAKDTSTKFKGLGSASVKWNSLTYREELFQQLSPGLTWRIGKGDATRLKVSGMALATPEALILPGEMTLNLRYWEQTRWELIAYEENDWSWSEDKNEFGTVPTIVGKWGDPEKAVERLTLELRASTKAEPSAIPGTVLTGDAALAKDIEEGDPSLEYSTDARKELEAQPLLELLVRFGPHVAVTRFEPVKVSTLKSTRLIRVEGKKKPKKQKLRLMVPQYGAVKARTEWLEKFDGELLVALMTDGAPGGKPLNLILTGGEAPQLWPVTVKKGEELDELDGERVETKKTPKTLEAELEGTRLTIHADRVDYVFDLNL